MATRRPRLVIHLGNKKTGSTSLQWFISQNEEALKARGISLVRAGRSHVSHNPVPKNMRGGAPSEIWSEVEQEVIAAPDTTHIMSSEVLFDRDVGRNMAQQMPESLRENLRFVVYLRRQDSYLEAMYKQLAKNGRIQDGPTEFAATFGEKLCSYEPILGEFEQVAGKDAITVRRFERAQLKNGDTTADFFSLIGVDTTETGFSNDEYTANVTLSRPATELLGALGRRTGMNARVIAREVMRGEDAPPRRSGDVYPKSVRCDIMERYAEENARIAARHVPDAPKTLFDLGDLADDKPDTYPTPEEELTLYADAQEKIAGAIGRVAAWNRDKLFRGKPPKR